MNSERLIEICEQIVVNTRNDAKAIDDFPTNGDTAVTYLANLGAAVVALSDILKEVIKEIKDK